MPIIAQFMGDLDMKGRTKALLMALCPLMIISCLSLLFMTNVSLPYRRTSWFNILVNRIRPIRLQDAEEARSIAAKNQFGVGDINFNHASVIFLVIPSVLFFIAAVDDRILKEDEHFEPGRKLTIIADLFGLTGTVVLSFFLIPVARHSVLLVAIGWSPVHALRFHIWSGFTAYIYIFFHSLLYVVEWIMYQDGKVGDLLFPDKECFIFFMDDDFSDKCKREWYNFTGVIGTVAYTVLCVTSLNWFRRRNYRLFYLFHIFSGTSMLLAALAHWRTFIVYLLPSLLYYITSTTPPLLQALASRFRGGVKIVKVVPLSNSGGCVEVQIDATADASAHLARSASLFVKLCVPKISVVWHPFTVYQHPKDLSTIRFLFRPTGPFTKALSKALTGDERPVTIVDGFYRGGDRHIEALQHDDVIIVAGGVALTPFLSMICQLLSKLKSSFDDEVVRTQRVTLVWICRERGLISFACNNFLFWMMQQAKIVQKNLPEFEFLIKIYFTGRDEDERTEISPPSSTNNLSVADLERPDCTAAIEEAERPQEDINVIKSCKCDQVRKGNSSDGHGLGREANANLRGTPMFMAHLMPAKSSKMIDNVPIFLVFSLMLWLGFIIMFKWYQFREYTTNPIAERMWGFLIGTVAIFGIAVIYEGGMMCFERALPRRRADIFEVEIDSNADDVTNASDVIRGTNQFSFVDETISAGVRLETKKGRPDPSEYFETARKAACPGLFFCGPIAMTDALKMEARKENSKYGLTRFCLYEDPFDM